MRQPDYTAKLVQLNKAKANYEAGTAALQKASANDGVDRKGTIASEYKCLASIERQIADCLAATAPAREVKPAEPVSENPAPDSNPT